jgi:hypothetical protein
LTELFMRLSTDVNKTGPNPLFLHLPYCIQDHETGPRHIYIVLRRPFDVGNSLLSGKKQGNRRYFSPKGPILRAIFHKFPALMGKFPNAKNRENIFENRELFLTNREEQWLFQGTGFCLRKCGLTRMPWNRPFVRSKPIEVASFKRRCPILLAVQYHNHGRIDAGGW